MAQCRANTKKGDRCRRDASEGSEYCSTHRSREADSEVGGWELAYDDLSDRTKTALGFAALGTIIYWALKLGRR